MHRIRQYVRVAALAATGLALWATPSSGVVVALKDRVAVATGGSLDSTFTGAIGDSSISVYTDAVADTCLYPAGVDFWKAHGTVTSSPAAGNPALFQFDLSKLPGFGPGAVINKAELRIRGNTGNSGTILLGYITTQDWAEGNKNGYPGAAPAAPGASLAHPRGLNTSTNQKADGTPGTSTSGSWGVNGDTQFSAANDSAIRTGTTQKTYANSFRVWSVADLVNDWAQGTVRNRGFLLYGVPAGTSSYNYTWRLSEYGTTDANSEPTLFIDYTPAVPEPATLALVAMSGLVLLRRRHV